MNIIKKSKQSSVTLSSTKQGSVYEDTATGDIYIGVRFGSDSTCYVVNLGTGAGYYTSSSGLPNSFVPVDADVVVKGD